MANTVNNDTNIVDDKHLSFGNSDDFKLEYSSGNTRLELKNSSDTVRQYFPDAALYGTYTPTATGITNVASTGTQTGMYARNSNIVNVSGSCVVTPTAGSTLTALRLSLPASSTFSNTYEAAGAGSFTISSTQTIVEIKAHTTNNELQLDFVSNGTGAHTIYWNAMYQVL